MSTKSFPLKATCTECGHEGNVFINDASIAKQIEEHMKKTVLEFWRPLATKRLIASWVIAFSLGYAVCRVIMLVLR